jgi:hypothetical protein
MSKGKSNSIAPFERFLGAVHKPRWTKGHVPSRSDDQPSDYRLNAPRYVRRLPLWVPILRVLIFFGVITGSIILFGRNAPNFPFIMGGLLLILVIVLAGIISSESVWKKNIQDKQDKHEEENN